jgi:hypothetical protein
MSWAMRRRILYLLGVTIFFSVLIGVPVAYKLSTVPPTCHDGQQNQGETAPDKGGPCALVDTSMLAPSSVLWTRTFKIRDGSYSATSYIQNPNDHAGVANISYIFRLYDAQNILVAERRGETYIMPGGITPIYQPDIDTGNRSASHAFFEFTSKGTWEHFDDTSRLIRVTDRIVSDADTVPRLEAKATNTSVGAIADINFVAVIFDTAGNAFASSATHVDRLEAGDSKQIVFTWPNPFALQVGRIDIIPVLPPKAAWTEQ